MRGVVLSLITVLAVGCHQPKPRVITTSEKTCYLDSTPSMPARHARATAIDSALASSTKGMLVVIVNQSTTDRPLRSTQVHASQVYPATVSDSNGIARLSLPPGMHKMRARQMGYSTWTDSVRVRTGFADTIRLGLGLTPTCIYSVIVGPYLAMPTKTD